jgi:hypothetical protein
MQVFISHRLFGYKTTSFASGSVPFAVIDPIAFRNTCSADLFLPRGHESLKALVGNYSGIIINCDRAKMFLDRKTLQ